MAVRDAARAQQPGCTDGTALISMVCEVGSNEDRMLSVAVYRTVNSLGGHLTGAQAPLMRWEG